MKSDSLEDTSIPPILTLESKDPRLDELMKADWSVVGESWGARLRIDSEHDLEPARRSIAAVDDSEFELRQLNMVAREAAAQLLRLDVQTAADYPETPATKHRALTEPELAELAVGGARVFGAFLDDELVAATVVLRDGARAETEFTTVAARHRRRGLASAVKASAILTLSGEGVTPFGSGGSAANVGMIRVSERLGYVMTERWLSLQRP